MDVRVRNPSLGDLAERGVRDAAVLSDLPPLPLAGLEKLAHAVVHGFGHARHYPHRDKNCNPHSDNISRQNPCMDNARGGNGKKSLRQIVADIIQPFADKEGQVPFAKRARVGQATISRVLKLEQNISLEILQGLAKATYRQPYEMLIDDEQIRRDVVERYLQPNSPAPEATAPVPMPDSRKGKGEGEQAVEVAALRPKGKKERPATARAEKIPGRRQGTRRVRTKRQ